MTDQQEQPLAIARVGVNAAELAALPDIERVELTPYKFAKPWMAAFVAVLARGGDVSYACRTAQVNRTYVYDVRKADPVFAAAWREAEDVGTDLLEQVALRRATIGESKRVTRTVTTTVKGRVESVIETVTEGIEYDNGLVRFLLSSRRPATYRERIDHRITGGDGGPVQIEVYRHPDLTNPEDRKRVAELAQLAADPANLPIIEGTANGKTTPKRRPAAKRKAAAKPAVKKSASTRRRTKKDPPTK